MKQLHNFIFGLLCLVCLTVCGSSCSDNSRATGFGGWSPELFMTPPMESRPSALWSWLNGHLDPDQLIYELREMKAKGMRGPVMWDVGSLRDPLKMIPAGPAFLGDSAVSVMRLVLDEAERLGLELGLFASSSWNAGGPWIDTVNASKEIRSSEVLVSGPAHFEGPIPIQARNETWHADVRVFAVPLTADSVSVNLSEILDITRFFNADTLRWEVPRGEWRIIRFVVRNTGQHLECPSPNSNGLVIDHLSSKAARQHVEHLMNVLRKKDGGYGSLTTFMLDSYEVWDANDWTPDFVDQFIEMFGYDPLPFLPVLAGVRIDSEEISRRFLHDYRKAVSNLLIENHFSEVKRLLNDAGLKLMSEAGHGGYARVEPLKALGASDIPMGEFWNGSQFWVTKEAASAAHIYEKKYVASESFTGWRSWKDGPAHYKRLFDVDLCAGLNQVVFHTFSHNPPEAGLPGFVYHAGEHFNVNSTWWEYAAPMLAYMSRSSYMMQQGHFVGDLCLYYGDQAPNRVPARRIDPTLQHKHGVHDCQHCGQDLTVEAPGLGHGYDYDYINEEVILERMQVRKGKYTLPGDLEYSVMVLPDREEISPEVLVKLESFVRQGGVVYGPRPVRSTSMKNYPESDVKVEKTGRDMWGDCDGISTKHVRYGRGHIYWGMPLDMVLLDLGIVPDFKVDGLDNSNWDIDYIHRRSGGDDVYFVSNSSLDTREFIAGFRIPAGRKAWFWHADDGSIESVDHTEFDGTHTRINMLLPPAGSVFVVFTSDHTDLATDQKREITIGAAQQPLSLMKGWTISFMPGRGAPERLLSDTLIDLTQHPDEGVRFFSGTAVYENTFEIEGFIEAATSSGYFIDLGEVREVAEVIINGSVADTLWKHPYVTEITRFLKPGGNNIEIKVTNLWHNRLVGDAGKTDAQRVTKTNIQLNYKGNEPLIPSGLIGPVTILKNN